MPVDETLLGLVSAAPCVPRRSKYESTALSDSLQITGPASDLASRMHHGRMGLTERRSKSKLLPRRQREKGNSNNNKNATATTHQHYLDETSLRNCLAT